MIRRFLLTLLVGAAGLVVAVPGASGHVRLISASPFPAEVERVAPRELRLRFDEPPLVELSKVSVVAADGRELVIGQPRFDARDDSQVVVSLRSGRRGAYTVHWQMVGDDGHVVRGAYSFGIREVAGAPAPVAGAGPGIRSDIIRWLYFVALALAVGGLLLPVTMVGSIRDHDADFERGLQRIWKRSLALAAVASIAALHLDLYGYLDWAQQIVGGDLDGFSQAEIRNLRTEAPIGIAWTWTTIAWLGVLGLVFAAVVRPRLRSPLACAAGVLALSTSLGLTLSGHAANRSGPISIVIVADFLHLVAAALWLGGVAWLALAVWPSARDSRNPVPGDLLGTCLGRFSTLATYLVGTLMIAGGWLAFSRLQSPRDLLSGYGLLLSAKVLVALAALALGLFHRKVLLPALRPAHRHSHPGTRSLRLEAVLLTVAMLAAAMLTNTAPPR